MQACVLCRFSHVRLFAALWTIGLPGSSVHRILQARILEWVAMPSSSGSSQPRDLVHASYISCTSRQVFYHQHHLASPWIFIYLLTNGQVLLCNWDPSRTKVTGPLLLSLESVSADFEQGKLQAQSQQNYLGVIKSISKSKVDRGKETDRDLESLPGMFINMNQYGQ